MPYKNAPYYMLLVIAVIIAGFWPSYFSVWGEVPWQFHAHGVAASIWVLMVLFQSWAVHKSQLPLHRAVGKSSLILFPFLIGGLAAIIDVTAKGFLAGDMVRTLFGGEFLIGLGLAMAAYVVLYYRALAHRRRVWVHSGYMLATPLILFESPLSRVISPWVPAWKFEGPQDADVFMDPIIWSMGVELVVIAVLWWRLREKAKPFLVAGIFIVAQMLTMGLMHKNAVLEAVLAMLGRTPSSVVILSGFAIGAATSWAGWEAGKRKAMPTGGATAAA